MNMIEHIVELHGPACFGSQVRPDAVGAALSHLAPLVRDSVRMGMLRSSRRVGRPLKELAGAWDIRYSGQSAGLNNATHLHFLAPSLQDAAPRLFEQGMLFEDIVAPDDTGFDLAGKMVADVARKVEESERYDPPLLARVAKFDQVFRYGIDAIHLSGHKLQEVKEASIDIEVTRAAALLFAETPMPRRVRLAGVLDMIRISDRVFEILLSSGQRIRAVWAAEAVVHLKEYLSQHVVIEGSAIYRPSGSLLRIDTNAIAPASEQDRFFSELPAVTTRARIMDAVRRPQNGSNGINAIWGIWPGEETEEELLTALEELK